MNSLFDNMTNRRYLVQLSEMPGVSIPDYVGNYTPLDKVAASELPEQVFADPDTRRYPIDTKAATWLAGAIFEMQKQAGELDYPKHTESWVEGNITKNAELFEISEDLESVRGLIGGELSKVASDEDSNYAWLIKDANEQVVKRRYPIHDETGVRKAAEYFMENRGEYPHAVRREICSKVLRKAAALGIDESELPGEMVREAGDALPRTSVIMRELIHRANLSKDAEAGAALLNLNNVLSVADPNEVLESIDKIAEIVEDFDAVEGLRGSYGKRVTFPADFLYSVNTKEASAVVDGTISLGDHAFQKAALAELEPATAFAPVLGADFVSAIKEGESVDATKLAKKLSELGPADQYALVDHLRNVYA